MGLSRLCEDSRSTVRRDGFLNNCCKSGFIETCLIEYSHRVLHTDQFATHRARHLEWLHQFAIWCVLRSNALPRSVEVPPRRPLGTPSVLRILINEEMPDWLTYESWPRAAKRRRFAVASAIQQARFANGERHTTCVSRGSLWPTRASKLHIV